MKPLLVTLALGALTAAWLVTTHPAQAATD